MANINVSINAVYALFLPDGRGWELTGLHPGATRIRNFHGSPTCSPDEIVVPVDLITAARLRIIQPGDDSGIDDHTWAWLKMLSLTGGQS